MLVGIGGAEGDPRAVGRVARRADAEEACRGEQDRALAGAIGGGDEQRLAAGAEAGVDDARAVRGKAEREGVLDQAPALCGRHSERLEDEEELRLALALLGLDDHGEERVVIEPRRVADEHRRRVVREDEARRRAVAGGDPDVGAGIERLRRA